ncbi:MAG TPA: DUF3616 domain-containing protein, partial [Pyrinomonadaceae bacterium]|nr:DUF3616 domain-containing protein [Pyrinomonadaceae bacterium]
MKLHTRNPVLEFNDEPKLRESLSAAVFAEQDLWVASDETTSIERLSTDEGLIFRHHKTFLLEQLITLPAVGTDLDQEVDIEGMDRFDSYLWVIGSHSIKRKKVDSKDPDGDEKLIKKLAKTEDSGNRCLLARIPIIENGSSGELVRSTNPEPSGNPILNAGSLAGDVRSDALTDAIRKAHGGSGDTHLARFLDIPGKDNGFDIEGLAVTTNKAFVGLRGPVLRGWAVILEVSFQVTDEAELMLKD